MRTKKTEEKLSTEVEQPAVVAVQDGQAVAKPQDTMVEQPQIVQEVNENKDVEKENKRILCIDRFRGFCVFAMLIFQFLKNFPSLGFLSRLASHSLETGIVFLPGMTLADIIAPAFIFAIGLTYCLSFNKYKKVHGRKAAYIRYALRALSIIGVGGLLEACNAALDAVGGGSLGPVDIVFITFLVISLAAIIFKLVSLIPKINQKVKFIASCVLYGVFSVVGVLTLIIAAIDFFTLVGDISASTYGYWVTLQNIGMACLIALPLMEVKNWIRFVVAAVIFALFSVFHQIGNNQQLLDVVVHGGFLGGFGWGAMLIFDLFVAEMFYNKPKHHYLIVVSLFMIIGVLTTRWFGNINLGSCSPAFILVSVGLSGLIFFVFYLTDKIPHCKKFDPLVWWGKNPIIMFLIEFFVIGLFTSFAPASMLEGAPWWLATIEGIIAVALLTTICWLLSRRKKSISL